MKTAITAIVVTLALASASAARSDQQILNDLVATSLSIRASMDKGYQVVGGLQYYATNNGIAEVGIVANSGAVITNEQREAYNEAIVAMTTAEYYVFQQFSDDQAQLALDELEDAVDDFVEASVDLTTVLEINERATEAEATEDLQDDQDVQDYVEANESVLTVDSDTVDDYNESMETIEESAATAALWTAASVNEELNDFANETADEFGTSFTSVTDTFFDRNDEGGTAYVYFADQSHIWFRTALFEMNVGLEDILTQGANTEFYTEGPTQNYNCYVHGECD